MAPDDADLADLELKHPPIPAATVVLLRDGPGGLETLMVRRSAKLSFAGGMWVWPGGRVDDADRTGVDPTDTEGAARRAAVREAWEEVGLTVDPATLVWFSHWTPPPLTPKRFATHFFAAPVPVGEVAVDGGEILEHRWLAPGDALRRRNAGEIELAPPTWITCEHLAAHAGVAEALAALGRTEPEVFATRFMSVEGGGVALYHGDSAYESLDPTSEGPRHRLWMVPEGWRYERTPERRGAGGPG